VAVIRDGRPSRSPTPEFEFRAGDDSAMAALRELLING